jgi:hypothetical protein
VKKSAITCAMIVLAASSVLGQELYFTATQGNQIWVASRDGSGTPAVLFDNAASGSAGPAGMIVVLETVQKIFYGGGNYTEIDVANVDGSGTPGILWADAGDEHLGVTVDAGAGVLYWTTESGAAIRKGNLDGTGTVTEVFISLAGNADGSGTPTVIFDSADGVAGPRQIVFDATNDLLYWTQHSGSGSTGRIMVGNADGSGSPTVLFTLSPPQLPYGIDIDVAAGTVYWADFDPEGGSDRIMRGNADGSGTPTVLHAGDFGSVRGIAAAANLVPVELLSLGVE